MQRINISVDMESNKILEKEIEKAIEGEVKTKTRKYFHDTIEKETLRIADKATENLLKKRGAWGDKPSIIEQMIEEHIVKKVEKAIGETKISKVDIQKEVDKKIKNIENVIANEVTKKIECIDFKDYIAELVEEEIQKTLPQKVWELIVKVGLRAVAQGAGTSETEGVIEYGD